MENIAPWRLLFKIWLHYLRLEIIFLQDFQFPVCLMGVMCREQERSQTSLLCYPCSWESGGLLHLDIWAASTEAIVEQHSCVHAALHTAETSLIHWQNTKIHMVFFNSKQTRKIHIFSKLLPDCHILSVSNLVLDGPSQTFRDILETSHTSHLLLLSICSPEKHCNHFYTLQFLHVCTSILKNMFKQEKSESTMIFSSGGVIQLNYGKVLLMVFINEFKMNASRQVYVINYS